MKGHNSTSFRKPSSFCSNNEVDISYILVPHGKCVDRHLPWFHLPAWSRFPWSSSKPFCHGRVSLTAIFTTKMPPHNIENGTTSVTLLHVFQWTNMFREDPPCPAFASQAQTSQIWINLDNESLTMKLSHICQTLFMLCSRVLLCQLIRLNFKKNFM